ncbi:MAG TPA: hypothetical protein VFC41_01140, partial [Anaerovoracaceae bacterium]|nr:hypothetical protein [Anaerovoracaceae bacterium]
MKKGELQSQFNLLKSNEKSEKVQILSEFSNLERKDSLRKADMLSRIHYLKETSTGYPVTLFSDTLFSIYTKIGASTPRERARNISKKIKSLYDDDFLKLDSLITMEAEYARDIIYGETIIMSITELDALMNNSTKLLLANE